MTETAHIQNAQQYWKQWQEEMNTLNHHIFFSTEAGVRWLRMMEEKYFYSPVADPSQDVAFAHFNEGRNNFIRSIRASAQAAMLPKQPSNLQQDIDYERVHEET